MKIKFGIVGTLFILAFGTFFYYRYVDKEKLHGDIARLVVWGEKTQEKIEDVSVKVDEYRSKFDELSKDYEELEQKYGKFIDGQETIPENPEDVDQAVSDLNNSALLAANQGKYTQARDSLLRAIELEEKREQSSYKDMSELYRNYASVLRANGDLEQAAEMETKATQLAAQGLDEPDQEDKWSGEKGLRLLRFKP